MNFNLQDNQHGTLVTQAIDASGAPAALPTDQTASSSDNTVATVAAQSGFPGNFVVTAVKGGNVDIVVSSPSLGISTTFSFAISGGPAVGFTATLINVQNN